MTDNDPTRQKPDIPTGEAERLLNKLENLVAKQQNFQKDIDEIRKEIEDLQMDELQQKVAGLEAASTTAAVHSETAALLQTEPEKVIDEKPAPASIPEVKHIPKKKQKSNIEKFIGENLINKIGIIIIVIGAAIGAKYAIDNQLISPLTRIVLGYLLGFGLLTVAFRLKEKYENYSAVLLSGAMAIMYFITFAAYSFYDLIPQMLTFTLMLVFTAFTVFSAILYNRIVIAHIGLVGAYAIPFFLSDNSGRIALLFSYMSIINVGILIVAIKKYWKSLYYSSFVFTWLIYLVWYIADYDMYENMIVAMVFALVFFLIFYATFLAYKLHKNEKFSPEDIFLITSNSFLFYGFGYSILNEHEIGLYFLGLFTLINALIHFAVAVIIFKKKLADNNLFYLMAGMVLLFIAIAIPVQLDGSWVTIFWAGEGALLFAIGRTKHVPFYERFSYPLMALAFFSIIGDWTNVYNVYDPQFPDSRITPIFNVNFLTSILFVAAFAIITKINYDKKYPSPAANKNSMYNVIKIFTPFVLLVGLYFSFAMEISNYFHQAFLDSGVQIQGSSENYLYTNYDLDIPHFGNLWIINYTMLFFTIFSFVNIKKIRNKNVGMISLVINSFIILTFLTAALYDFGELRLSYLNQNINEYFDSNISNILIRYISLLFLSALFYANYLYAKSNISNGNLQKPVAVIFNTTMVFLLGNEWISWMHIAGYEESYKLGLSILWGIYALIIVVLGILKKQKHLRIFAIVLFAITLMKLFFYDISHLDTIEKTIVFVSLGILLLIISFLYNKYTKVIYDENEA